MKDYLHIESMPDWTVDYLDSSEPYRKSVLSCVFCLAKTNETDKSPQEL